MKRIATMLLLSVGLMLSTVLPVRAGDPQLPPVAPPCTEDCRLAPAIATEPSLPVKIRWQITWAVLSALLG